MDSIDSLVDQASSRGLDANGHGRCCVVALTGIDGCGKGWVGRRVVEELEARGLRVALIGVDRWLNLPGVRFGGADPGRHFYDKAIRFDEMFEQLVAPLRERRSLDLEMDAVAETAMSYHHDQYSFQDIDVILLEGIFLLKRRYRHLYDLSAWIDCTFQTALERAIARSQEGLSPEETTNVYRSIYFPAQEIHLREDDPRSAATLIILNDPRLALS